MTNLNDLKIKIFLDTANLESIQQCKKKYPYVRGFTTNPSLMYKSGVKDYKQFSKDALKLSNNLPISFEVFSDDLKEMETEGRIINSWGGNSYIKIPITNTKRESTKEVIQKLTNDSIKVNVTAIFTLEQVENIINYFDESTPAILSVFAGRIADSGMDPMEIMKKSSEMISDKKNLELLWASTREVLNIFQAEESKSDIITVPPDILDKTNLLNKNLNDFSLETVQNFFDDAKNANFKIKK